MTGGRVVTEGPAAAGRPRLLWVDVDQLLEHPTEAEPLGLGDLEQLTASVRACGIVQPLLVEPINAGDSSSGWRILDGHHRAEVARRVGLRRVPCTVSVGVDAEVVTLASNAVRRTMPPVQQARAFGRLRGRGLTLAQIAARTGYTAGHISSRLALLDLDEATLARVEAGRIAAEQATAAVRGVRRGDADGGSGSGRRPRAMHFGPGHRLAAAAADRCADQHGRRAAGRLGGVACGPCWEHVIRADCTANRAADCTANRAADCTANRAAGSAQPPEPLPRAQHPVPPPAASCPQPAPALPPAPRPPLAVAQVAQVAQHDEARVRQVLAGAAPGGLSRADRLEVARRVDSAAQLAELLEVSWDAADRLIRSAHTVPRTEPDTGRAAS